MKMNFNKQQILDIALAVTRYKKMFVTTEGVMFQTEESAENAVRIKNMIVSEPNDFVGIATITAEMVTVERLRVYAKDPEAFEKLFEGARIPRQRNMGEPKPRQVEEPLAPLAQEQELARALEVEAAPAHPTSNRKTNKN